LKKVLISTENGGHYIFKKDFIRDDKKGIIICKNEETLKKQKQAINILV